MDKQVPSSVILDLGKLPFSDGNGQKPNPTTHDKLEDAEMLKLLEEAFDKDAALMKKWGKKPVHRPLWCLLT